MKPFNELPETEYGDQGMLACYLYSWQFTLVPNVTNALSSYSLKAPKSQECWTVRWYMPPGELHRRSWNTIHSGDIPGIWLDYRCVPIWYLLLLVYTICPFDPRGDKGYTGK